MVITEISLIDPLEVHVEVPSVHVAEPVLTTIGITNFFFTIVTIFFSFIFLFFYFFYYSNNPICSFIRTYIYIFIYLKITCVFSECPRRVGNLRR